MNPARQAKHWREDAPPGLQVVIRMVSGTASTGLMTRERLERAGAACTLRWRLQRPSVAETSSSNGRTSYSQAPVLDHFALGAVEALREAEGLARRELHAVRATLVRRIGGTLASDSARKEPSLLQPALATSSTMASSNSSSSIRFRGFGSGVDWRLPGAYFESGNPRPRPRRRRPRRPPRRSWSLAGTGWRAQTCGGTLVQLHCWQRAADR